MINIKTKFITLIGTPLTQSFAARMQNAGYQAAQKNIQYFYTETGSEHLEEIINGIRYMPSFIGAAVTKPNKVEVMKYLDEFDPLCEKMGACNTVVKLPSGKLKGYNTDGIGFYTSLTEEAKIDITKNTFFCVKFDITCHIISFTVNTICFNSTRMTFKHFIYMFTVSIKYSKLTLFKKLSLTA